MPPTLNQKNITNNNCTSATIAFKPNICLKNVQNNNDDACSCSALSIKDKQKSYSHSKSVRNFCDISYEKVKRHKLRYNI